MLKRRIVASLVWQRSSQLHELQAEEIKKLGFEHQFFLYNEPIPADCEVIIVQGPYGSLVPMVRQLLEMPQESRPVLVYWFQQSLHMQHPEKLRFSLSELFSDLHRHYNQGGRLSRSIRHLLPENVLTKGRRLSFAGDIIWLHQNGLLDLLVLSSTVYADYFAKFGIPATVLPRGYHPSYGSLLNLERDIAAVWMGKTRTRRRRNIVYCLQEELAQRDLSMHIYDGQQNDFIFGEKRTQILNRACLVLNIFFSGPTDELSIRFYVAAANGAVVMTEPGLNEYPFIPNTHLIECPVHQMADRISYYVQHREELETMAGNMSHLMQEELCLSDSVAKFMQEAELILASRQRNLLQVDARG